MSLNSQPRSCAGSLLASTSKSSGSSSTWTMCRTNWVTVPVEVEVVPLKTMRGHALSELNPFEVQLPGRAARWDSRRSTSIPNGV